jgi:hypothetical protein
MAHKKAGGAKARQGGNVAGKRLGVKVFGQVPIGQPLDNSYVFSGKEEAGKVYDSIAKEVLREMEL